MAMETRLSKRLTEINTSLDQWVLEYKPLNHAQCVSMLEHAIILSRLEVVKYIFAVINGFESELFLWNSNRQQFVLAKGYAMAHLNMGPFQSFLGQFADAGTKFRQMYEFTQFEYFRGQTFNAFQSVLRNILDEIIGQMVEILDSKFVNNKKQTVNEFTISLLALAPFLDSDENGNILLVIHNLYSIYVEIIAEDNFNRPRFYCNQTLAAIYKRTSIPHKRIRNIVYTLLDYCLRPLFISIEYLLTHFQHISELSESSEFIFSSKFKTDEELYYASYPPTELAIFWNDFFNFDSHLCQGFPLLSFGIIKELVDAIKASFIFRKNGLLHSALTVESGQFLSEFRENLKDCLRRYAHPEDEFNIENPYHESQVQLEILPSIKHLIKLPPQRMCRFTGFNLPICISVDIHAIMDEALGATFARISRPIVQNFLSEFRVSHLKLFRFYADFFLVQHSEHILQYIYFLFPLIKDVLAKGSYHVFSQKLQEIHRSNTTEFAKVLTFFKPNLLQPERLNEHRDHTRQLNLFNSIYFLPSFANDFKETTPLSSRSARQFYDFWPLSQLFNSNVSSLFNELFQFLLKLRYCQYQLGAEFFLSPKFGASSLSREDYLCRYRMLNQLVLMGRQMEWRLKELVQTTELRLKSAATFEEYLASHQRFLEKVSQFNSATKNGIFVENILNSVSKFCHLNSTISTKIRRPSIYEALGHLDLMGQDEYFDSLHL